MENSLLAEKLEAPMKIECFYQQPGTSSQKPACGFTLIEVSVAVLIMSIVLVSIYKMHSQSIAMNTEARFYTQAPMLAQGKLAELETSTEDEIAADSGDFGENFPGYTWSVAVDSVDIEALGEISEDLQRIDVTVSYNNGEFDYRFRTYRFTRK
jgi:general secretion pathway protein I